MSAACGKSLLKSRVFAFRQWLQSGCLSGWCSWVQVFNCAPHSGSAQLLQKHIFWKFKAGIQSRGRYYCVRGGPGPPLQSPAALGAAGAQYMWGRRGAPPSSVFPAPSLPRSLAPPLMPSATCSRRDFTLTESGRSQTWQGSVLGEAGAPAQGRCPLLKLNFPVWFKDGSVTSCNRHEQEARVDAAWGHS